MLKNIYLFLNKKRKHILSILMLSILSSYCLGVRIQSTSGSSMSVNNDPSTRLILTIPLDINDQIKPGDIVIAQEPDDAYMTVSKRAFPTRNDNEYWLVGDNRRFSWDSRIYGPVPRDLIHRKLLIRLFKLPDFISKSLESKWNEEDDYHYRNLWKENRKNNSKKIIAKS